MSLIQFSDGNDKYMNLNYLFLLYLFSCLATPSFGQLIDSLPPLKDGKAPQTFDELWQGYDPRAEPLDVEVLKEWEEDGVIMKVLRYRIGVFNGKKAMMAAIYGYPKGAENLPGLVQIHGGGQFADHRAVLTNAKRGYATISIAWAGRVSAPDYIVNKHDIHLFWDDKTSDPNYRVTTDWGEVDAYHAPCRYKGSDFIRNSPASSAYSLDPVESPRNSGWFLCTIGSRRALTFLEEQPEVDADRLGAYGHSMGGKLTVMLAGVDSRVKAAAPSCGGISDSDAKRSHRLLLDDVSLNKITCPIFFLSPANDFHGRIEDLQAAPSKIKTKEWRFTCAPHHLHQDTKDYEVATQIWFDQILKRSFVTPKTPHVELEKSTSGAPSLTIIPDVSKEILSVDVFVTRDAAKKAADRFWHYFPAQESNGKWTAPIELCGLDKPLWVYANVRYKLPSGITGAGYYYGIYTTGSFVVSSEMLMISSEQLKADGIRAVLKADEQIEDFSEEWEKEWYIYSNDPNNWRLSTRRLGDDLYAAPDCARLSVSVRSEQPNTLVLLIDDTAAAIELAGNNEWQSFVLDPMDFRGVGERVRSSWENIKSLQLTDVATLDSKGSDKATSPLTVGSRWKGAAPELRDMRWVSETVAEHSARREVKLLNAK